MNCHWLTNNLGYECRPVPALRTADVALEVDTPFRFSDGEPIGFYLVESGPTLRVSDNADTLSHLSALGLAHDSRRNKSIRDRIAKHGLVLSDYGEIYALGDKASAETLIASYISALLSISEYESEALRSTVATDLFILEVEASLKVWKPGESLIKRPKITGLSRNEYSFDFRLGPRLIDAITPRANSTGAMLRKASDVLNGPKADNLSILAVIDDRTNPESAEIEKAIISGLTSAVLFSRLPHSHERLALH